MNNKYIIIIIVILLGLTSAILWLVLADQEPKKLDLSNHRPDIAAIANGTLYIADTETGSVFIVDGNQGATFKTLQRDILRNAREIIPNQNSDLALVAKNADDERTAVVNLGNGEVVAELDLGILNPTWLGKSDIIYSSIIPDSGDLIDGLYIYNMESRTTKPLIMQAGSTEDKFATLGNYLVYVQSSTDATPVTIQVINLGTKRVINKYELNSFTQLLQDKNRIALIGDKMVVLTLENNNIRVSEKPIFAENAIYSISDDSVWALTIYSEQIKLGTISWSANTWAERKINIDLESLGYILNFKVLQKEVIVIGDQEAISYPLK
jgi:hypothetical protein